MTHYAIIPLADNYIIGSLAYRLAMHNRKEFMLLFSQIDLLVQNYGGSEFMQQEYRTEMMTPAEMNVYQYNRLLCKIIAV